MKPKLALLLRLKNNWGFPTENLQQAYINRSHTHTHVLSLCA